MSYYIFCDIEFPLQYLFRYITSLVQQFYCFEKRRSDTPLIREDELNRYVVNNQFAILSGLLHLFYSCKQALQETFHPLHIPFEYPPPPDLLL